MSEGELLCCLCCCLWECLAAGCDAASKRDRTRPRPMTRKEEKELQQTAIAKRLKELKTTPTPLKSANLPTSASGEKQAPPAVEATIMKDISPPIEVPKDLENKNTAEQKTEKE